MRAQVIGNGRLKGRIPAEFAAALQALQLQGEDARALQSMSDIQWRELLPMLDRSRMTLPLAQRGYSGLPCWVQERLRSNLADTAQHWRRVLQAAYCEAAAALDAVAVEHLVLKGFTQAPEFVARPEFRRQYDLDLYIQRWQIPTAVRALQEIGYFRLRKEEDCPGSDHVAPLARFGEWKWNGSFYDPHVPPVIEIHYCLWNDALNAIAVPEIEEFWNRRKRRRIEDLAFPSLDPIDHVGYLALHILREVFKGEPPLHLVREMATFVHWRADDSPFWGEWRRNHSARMRSMEAIAFWLASAWFSCRLPEAVKEEIDALSPLVRSWLERWGSVPFECLFRRTREGRLLQFVLADSHEARRTIVRMALLPGNISSPAEVASFGTHPTSREEPRLILRYLSYPGYLLSRTWMNGCAILRLLAHACLLYARRDRVRSGWHEAMGIVRAD